MTSHNDLHAEIAHLKAENERLAALLEKHGIEWHKVEPDQNAPKSFAVLPSVTLNIEQKITLFRSLFRGRTDVYPARWESAKGAGYSPVCANEWKSGVCQKPKVKCSNCDYRDFSCVTDQVVYDHLAGKRTIGVYPLLHDETCFFLAVDFDDENWRDDVQAFRESCRESNVPVDVAFVTCDDEDEPWKLPPREDRIVGPLPKSITLILANHIFIAKDELPQQLVNRLIRIAAFQNPEFYRAQAMRLPVWNKPRIIGCAENFPKHISMPRGSLDEIVALFDKHGIDSRFQDERTSGDPISTHFTAELLQSVKF